MKVKKLDFFVRRAKAGRIVSLTGFGRKLHVGFCLTQFTSIDDINFTDLILTKYKAEYAGKFVEFVNARNTSVVLFWIDFITLQLIY